ncbi:MAG: DUF1592 domain-containing protein [Myxococcota bacterium]
MQRTIPLLLALTACQGVFDAGHSGTGSETRDRPMPGGPGGGSATLDDVVVCDPGTHVGYTPLRLLTRGQFNGVTRDLTGQDLTLGSNFGDDQRAGPFAANYSRILATSDVENFMLAAEELAEVAVSDSSIVGCSGGVDCAESTIRSFGRRAWRRPLTDVEVQELMGLYSSEGSFNDGVQRAFEMILQSPSLYYRVEEHLDVGGDGVAALDPMSVASRLSFFLWRSGPDDTLLDLAERGALLSEGDVEAAARRLLEDPRAAATIRDFHFEWLGLYGNSHVSPLADLTKNPDVYPNFDGSLRDAMGEETRRFIDHIFSPAYPEPERRLQALFGSDFTFVNAELAAIYGLPQPNGWEQVITPGDRRGILTQPGVLATYGGPENSAPLERGLLMRELVLCDKVEPPGEELAEAVTAAGEALDEAQNDGQLTRREKVEAIGEIACAGSCHAEFIPLGLAFESYDGIGQFRIEESGDIIDPSGELAGTDVDGPFTGSPDLMDRLLGSERLRQCVTQRWMEYALERPLQEADVCAVRELSANLEQSGDLRELLVEIVKSPAFRSVRVR